MKMCPRCKLLKTLSEFSNAASRKDGLQGICKGCSKEYAGESRAKNRLKIRANKAALWRNNPEKIRGYRRKSEYGISPEAWASILESQGGLCAICKGVPKKFCVDHNHTTGKVRGMLCQNCNAALGLLQDSIFVAFGAVDYLVEHSENCSERDKYAS